MSDYGKTSIVFFIFGAIGLTILITGGIFYPDSPGFIPAAAFGSIFAVGGIVIGALFANYYFDEKTNATQQIIRDTNVTNSHEL